MPQPIPVKFDPGPFEDITRMTVYRPMQHDVLAGSTFGCSCCSYDYIIPEKQAEQRCRDTAEMYLRKAEQYATMADALRDYGYSYIVSLLYHYTADPESVTDKGWAILESMGYQRPERN